MAFGVVKVGFGLIGIGETEKQARTEAQAVSTRCGPICIERLGALSIVKLSEGFIKQVEWVGNCYQLMAGEVARRRETRERWEEEQKKKARKEARNRAAGLAP